MIWLYDICLVFLSWDTTIHRGIDILIKHLNILSRVLNILRFDSKHWLLDTYWWSSTQHLVLHLQILHVFIHFGTCFCPHLQIIVDLMLSERLIDLWSFFIQFAIINIFMVCWWLKAHVWITLCMILRFIVINFILLHLWLVWHLVDIKEICTYISLSSQKLRFA